MPRACRRARPLTCVAEGERPRQITPNFLPTFLNASPVTTPLPGWKSKYVSVAPCIVEWQASQSVFFAAMAVVEDSGYLSRAAWLMDALIGGTRRGGRSPTHRPE